LSSADPQSRRLVVLMWNDRKIDEAHFSGDYERIVHTYNTESRTCITATSPKDDAAAIRSFFVQFPRH